ncbi:MAG: hypothetical protein ACI841_000316 [Planctomycetota bacterium]|jgi:hypothetical protein
MCAGSVCASEVGPSRCFRIIGYREPLILHDLHDVLRGHDTSLIGEIEIAAWELASDGCGASVFFWIIQIGALLLGLTICPRSTYRAFRAGMKHRNLYRSDPDQILGSSFSCGGLTECQLP